MIAGSIPAILRHLRLVLALACVLSLIAFAVRWSTDNPERALARPLVILADLPGFVVTTLGDLFSDGFRLSRVPDEFGSKASYAPLLNRTEHDVKGLVRRTSGMTGRPEPRWRLLYGIFTIDGAPRHAVLALSPAFAITHVWLVPPEPLNGPTLGQAPYPHGVALLPDGSIVAAFDDEQRTVRIGYCGERVWGSDTDLNHALYPTQDQRFVWGVGTPDELHKLDLRTGRLVERITMEEVRAANPDVSALAIRRIDDNRLGDNPRGDADVLARGPYHINDAEPLPAALAPAFPMFRAGDLLVSFRNLNMVLVLDPQTRAIKWLTNDNLLRQHDPDWNADGTISVLDNQMGRAFSRIVRFSPATGSHETIVPGEASNFYTRIRGKHQLLPGGGVLITSSQQGRMFELDKDGRLAAEILVQAPDSPGHNFVLSEAMLLPADNPLTGKVPTCPR